MKYNTLRRAAIGILLFVCMSGCRESTTDASPVDTSLSAAFDESALTIETSDGSMHRFNVYIAQTPEQQRRGLMFVRQLPADSGMLFIYDEPGMRSMWMKNTFISLDLIFADQDGTIRSIVHDAEPLTLTSRGSTEPVSWVLELNGGTARQRNINVGSRIHWNDTTR